MGRELIWKEEGLEFLGNGRNGMFGYFGKIQWIIEIFI
jgi:hypothetical protein